MKGSLSCAQPVKTRAMTEKLIEHLRKYVVVDEQDTSEILSFFQQVSLEKKEILIAENQICRSNFFVLKGCLRMFFISEKGIERTIHFAIENWWITDYFAFENRKATTFHIESVEKSEILEIDYNSQERLLKKFPE